MGSQTVSAPEPNQDRRVAERRAPLRRREFAGRIFDVVVMGLTVAALLLAVKQYQDSRQQNEDLKLISTRISTQAVGTFPSNMDAILNLVSSCDKDLKIMTDVAGYGHFSAPDKFEAYLQKLIDKKRAGQKIMIVVYGDDAYKEDTAAQLKPRDFDKLLAEPNQTRLRRYFETFHPDSGGIPPSHAKFLEELAHYEAKYRDRMLENGLELRIVPKIHDLPFFLWLRDDHEAVFSFYNLGDNVREITFRTTDGNLIAAFNDVFQQVLPLSKKTSKDNSLVSDMQPQQNTGAKNALQ